MKPNRLLKKERTGAIHKLTRIRHEIRGRLFVEFRVLWWIVVLALLVETILDGFFSSLLKFPAFSIVATRRMIIVTQLLSLRRLG
jgi:hypothetical protein